MTAECDRCGATFAPDTRHLEMTHQWKPPENPAHRFTLCARCADEFGKWLEGSDR